MNANLQEGLSGVRVSQAFVREERNEEVFSEVAAGYRDARIRAQRLVAIYFPFVDFLSDIAAAIVLGAGSVLVANGSVNVGELIAFLLYLNLFFAPIQQLSQVFDSYQQATGRDLAHHRAARHADDGAATGASPSFPARLRGEVVLDDVRFQYAHRGRRGAARRRHPHRSRARRSRSSARPARASRR